MSDSAHTAAPGEYEALCERLDHFSTKALAEQAAAAIRQLVQERDEAREAVATQNAVIVRALEKQHAAEAELNLANGLAENLQDRIDAEVMARRAAEAEAARLRDIIDAECEQKYKHAAEIVDLQAEAARLREALDGHPGKIDG
jgi:chromosome segregation ATPase